MSGEDKEKEDQKPKKLDVKQYQIDTSFPSEAEKAADEIAEILEKKKKVKL